MAIIDKIQLSGTVYTIGNETTTAVTSASTDNEIPTAKAVYDAIPQGGGGKAISAGTNISITTGETADTINCKLPYYIDSGACWTIFGDSRYASNKSTNASNSAYIGFNNEIKNTSTRYNTYDNIIIGSENKLDSYYDSFGIGDNVIIGEGNTLSGRNNISESYVIGRYNKGYSSRVFVCGYSNESRNHYETSFGHYNNSVSATTSFGDSGNTLFSVGNGTSNSARHNAFEIRQNGDIYITKDGQDVKLQDQLGGGGVSTYTAGDGINITNDVISVTGKVDTSAITTSVTSSSTDSQVPSAKAVYDALQEGGGGGSITIDPSLDSGSTNPVANSAITNTIYNQTARFNGAASYGYLVNISSYEDGNAISIDGIRIKTEGNSISQTSVGPWLYTSTINGKKAVSKYSSNTKDFSLVETSAITTSVTSSSTDAQVPSAKAVYDMVGNINTILESI